MPDYSKSIIYTIRTRDGLYVGSTTNFINRKYQHKQNIKDCERKLYKTIRENDGEWDMKPYKQFPCESKIQLVIEEERIRCELKADLNQQKCFANFKSIEDITFIKKGKVEKSKERQYVWKGKYKYA